MTGSTRHVKKALFRAPFFYFSASVNSSFRETHASRAAAMTPLFCSLRLTEIVWPDHIPTDLFDPAHHPGHLTQLREFGQIHPLLIQEQADGTRHLLAGHTCYLAMQATGESSAHCQLLPAGYLPKRAISLQILHNLHHNVLSPVLQAYILRQAQTYLPEKDLFDLLALMQHKPQRYILLDLLSLLQLDKTVLTAMHGGLISMKAGKHLAHFSGTEQRVLAELICRYQLGGSKQQKFLEMMTEIALRTQQTVQTILERWESQKKGEGTNSPQEAARLLAHLTAISQPARINAEQRFQKLVQDLHSPKNITIEHCPSFEDDSVEVRLHFNSVESLLNVWDTIKKITPP